MKQITGMTDEQIADAVRNTRASLEQMGLQERAVAIMALAALRQIEAERPEAAKTFLIQQIAFYRRTAHRFEPESPERERLLRSIDAQSDRSPELKEALAKKVE